MKKIIYFLSWLFGLTIIFSGVALLFSDKGPGILLIMAGLLLTPFSGEKIYIYVSGDKGIILRRFLFVLCFVIAGIIAKDETGNKSIADKIDEKETIEVIQNDKNEKESGEINNFAQELREFLGWNPGFDDLERFGEIQKKLKYIGFRSKTGAFYLQIEIPLEIWENEFNGESRYNTCANFAYKWFGILNNKKLITSPDEVSVEILEKDNSSNILATSYGRKVWIQGMEIISDGDKITEVLKRTFLEINHTFAVFQEVDLKVKNLNNHNKSNFEKLQEFQEKVIILNNEVKKLNELWFPIVFEKEYKDKYHSVNAIIRLVTKASNQILRAVNSELESYKEKDKNKKKYKMSVAKMALENYQRYLKELNEYLEKQNSNK